MIAWVGVALSVWLATLCASTDGAVLAIDPDDDLSSAERALYERRERTHRVLAFARVAAQLSAGVFVAIAARLAAQPLWFDMLVGGLVAILLVGLSEAYARSAGTMLGAKGIERRRAFLQFIEMALAPIAALGGWLDSALHRVLPPPKDADEVRDETAEQFKQVVATEADVSKNQEVLLNGVFRLGQTSVEEIMVPRVDIVAIDRDAPWSEVVDRLRSSEHARLPVFAETIDNVVGILYAKDLLPAIVADDPLDDWTSKVQPATFIPAGKSADEQLRDFQSARAHMAIVVDEFGGTAGLVTIENVLEEIVGDIRDEYDVEETSVDQEDGQRYWVAGRLTLDELSELLGVDFRHEEVTTVAGLVYEILGRVPKPGEQLEIHGFRVIVERVLRRRILRVYFERHQPDDEDEDA